MLWAHHGESSEDDEIQGALQQFDALGVFTRHSGVVRGRLSHGPPVSQVERALMAPGVLPGRYRSPTGHALGGVRIAEVYPVLRPIAGSILGGTK